jgi:hypothetical protein
MWHPFAPGQVQVQNRTATKSLSKHLMFCVRGAAGGEDREADSLPVVLWRTVRSLVPLEPLPHSRNPVVVVSFAIRMTAKTPSLNAVCPCVDCWLGLMGSRTGFV